MMRAVLQLNMPDSNPQRPLKQSTAQSELDQMRTGPSGKAKLNEFEKPTVSFCLVLLLHSQHVFFEGVAHC